MVSTRRQSGVAPRPSEALKRSLEAQDASENEYRSEDDYEEVETRKTSTFKRQKTSKASTSSKAPSKGSGSKAATKPSRRRKDLSLLPTMPLDILYEVRATLRISDHGRPHTRPDPESVGAKRFPQPISDQQGMAQSGCKPRDGIPLEECEEGIPSSRTTGRLHGAALGGFTFRNDVPGILYLLIFGSFFPEEDKDILNYVPHTFTGIVTKAYTWGSKGSKFYWDEDVAYALEQMGRLHGTELEVWKEEVTENIKDRAKMVDRYEKWVRHMEIRSRDDVKANREARLRAATQRFVDAGYELVDVGNAISIYSDGIYTGVPYITNAAWTKIRPQLEESVVEKRNSRLDEELQPMIKERMEILEDLYNAYLDRAARPAERYYYPPIEAFRPIPEVMEIVEADKDTTITAKDFGSIVLKFNQYVDDYQEELKGSLDKVIPADRRGHGAEQPFNMARHVFRRGSPTDSYSYSYYGKPKDNVLVGWNMIGAHLYEYSRLLEVRPGVRVEVPEEFAYNDRESRVSSKLITLAGLDPATATARDMDARDPRFVHVEVFTAIGYPIFTWRTALGLNVLLREESYRSTGSKFRLATAEEEAEAKDNEDTLRATKKSWSCNHCPDFLDPESAETLDVVIEHLRGEHAIGEPQPEEDFFVNERCRHVLEEPYEILIPNVQMYKCECNECRRCGYRRIPQDKLDEHLKKAHPSSYSRPVEGREYRPVPSGRDAIALPAADSSE
ncbi:hypothetical protein NMY22_g14314 [Coprinellus aureogranulatus]|nr:hypothetical protein NMY22_g14314 [Coprinellus aureogranulatus]